MANTVVSLFSIVVFCITAAQGRNALHPKSEWETASSPPVNDDDLCKTIVQPQGYHCEEHKVTTADGYILSLQRIPAGRSGTKGDKPPVLLQHGLLSDAFTWVVSASDGSFGYTLADNGYDVWVANSRGTRYSRGHQSLSSHDQAYWEWSWEELSTYDLPAFLQYVYNNTAQRVHYVGHSLGTLMGLVAFSEGQVLNMLRSAALLAPIGHMNQIPSPLLKLAADTFSANILYFITHEFIPNGAPVIKFLDGICHNLNLNCSGLIKPITGPNCCVKQSTIDLFLNHGVQSTSTKNMIHLSQLIRTGKVAKYDYGFFLNLMHYGHAVPPVYDLTRIPKEFPLYLSYGGKDFLSDVSDVKVLLNDLKDHDQDKLVVLFKEDHGHLDFVFGVNATQLIYDPMIAFFKAH